MKGSGSRGTGSKGSGSRSNGSKRGDYSDNPLFSEVVCLFVITVSIFFIFCVYSTDTSGFLGGVIGNFLRGLFGIGAYILPLISSALSVYILLKKVKKFPLFKIVFGILLFLSFISIASILSYKSDVTYNKFVDYLAAGYLNGSFRNGGLVGSVFADFFINLIGKPGSYTLLFATAVISLTLVTGRSFFAFVIRGYDFCKEKIGGFKDRWDEEREEAKKINVLERVKKIKPEVPPIAIPIEKPLPRNIPKSPDRSLSDRPFDKRSKKAGTFIIEERKPEQESKRVLLINEEIRGGKESSYDKAIPGGKSRASAKALKDTKDINQLDADKDVNESAGELHRNKEVTKDLDFKDAEYPDTVHKDEPTRRSEAEDVDEDQELTEFVGEDGKVLPFQVTRQSFDVGRYSRVHLTDGEEEDPEWEEEEDEDAYDTVPNRAGMGPKPPLPFPDRYRRLRNPEDEVDDFETWDEDTEDDKEYDDEFDDPGYDEVDELHEKIYEDEDDLEEDFVDEYEDEYDEEEAYADYLKAVEEYEFPPIDLLKENPYEPSSDTKALIMENSRKLEETLESFGVEAKVIEVNSGPTVTRYEVEPGKGVKVSRISGLADDLALNLAAMGIRIEAPIPGKAAVGIEIPNKEVMPVYLREVIDDDEFLSFPSKLSFPLGKDISGDTVVTDIAKMPHLLIAGATGSGKSVCINTLITGILYKARPDEVKLLMIDPKVVELSVYNGIPHLLIPVVTDPKKAAGALNWAVKEMIRRYNLFAETAVRDLKSYNALRAENEKEPLPHIVIIIDELADLMMAAPGEVEDAICRLAQMARAAGLHLIIATQRPSVDVITGLIKANVPSRLAFAVSSGTDSRTILDMIGAEKLLGKGDMLFSPVGIGKPRRIQGAFISDKEVEAIVNFLKKSHWSSYDLNMIEDITSANVTIEQEGEVDEFFDEAVRFVITKERASASMLQRQFRIGYNRASRMIEDMELRRIIGPEDGSKPRKVLIKSWGD